MAPIMTEEKFENQGSSDTLKIKEVLSNRENKRRAKMEAAHERYKNKTQEAISKRKIKNEHKIQKKIDKEQYAKNCNEIKAKSGHLSFRHFFTRWFYYGLVMVVVGICISIYNEAIVKQGVWKSLLEIVSLLSSSLGIAMFVGAVFDFSKNSEDFTTFVANILKRIVVTKEFLGEIANEEKKNVLELIIKPSDNEVEQCSSIPLYYRKCIDSFINLYNQPFKTNLTVNVIAKYENGRVVCEGQLTQRRYKINGVYTPIETNFEKKDSTISDAYVLLPNGKKDGLKEEEIVDNEKSNPQKRYITKIPEKMNKYPYVTVGKSFKEIGSDHWIMSNWSSLTPCDGICYELSCEGDLEIKEWKIFDDPELYRVSLSEGKKRITIVSNSWLNNYAGFTLIIGKKG